MEGGFGLRAVGTMSLRPLETTPSPALLIKPYWAVLQAGISVAGFDGATGARAAASLGPITGMEGLNLDACRESERMVVST